MTELEYRAASATIGAVLGLIPAAALWIYLTTTYGILGFIAGWLLAGLVYFLARAIIEITWPAIAFGALVIIGATLHGVLG